jgi:hypothetical protein
MMRFNASSWVRQVAKAEYERPPAAAAASEVSATFGGDEILHFRSPHRDS